MDNKQYCIRNSMSNDICLTETDGDMNILIHDHDKTSQIELSRTQCILIVRFLHQYLNRNKIKFEPSTDDPINQLNGRIEKLLK